MLVNLGLLWYSKSAKFFRIVERKPFVVVSYQIRHKPDFSATETSKKLELSDSETRKNLLSRQQKKALISLKGSFDFCQHHSSSAVQNLSEFL